MSVSQLTHSMYLSDVTLKHWETPKTVSSPQNISFMIARLDGTNELVIPQKTLPYAFGEQVLGPMLSKILEAAKNIDSAISKVFSLLPGAKAHDTGLIAHFEGPCPEGWEDYTSGGCRVFVSSGATTDSRGETRICSAYEKGGEFQHQQTVDEMPLHHHQRNPDSITEAINVNPLIGSSSIPGPYQVGNPVNQYTRTANTGGNQPHNNMPPYLVLQSCIKTASENYASQADLDSVETDISTLQSDVNALQSGSSSKKSSSNTLAVIGIITGIFGIIFGCMGMFGIRLDYSRSKNKNETIASEMQKTTN